MPDGTALLYIDRQLVHEVTSSQAFEGLRLAGRKARHPELTFATMDHNVPTVDRFNIKDPIAFIKDLKSNKQGMYRLGNVIQEAKVVQIVMGEVTLDLNGRRETLRLSKRGMSWAGMNADEIIISKNNLLSQTAEIYNSLRSITVKPHYEAQKVVGMQVNGIPEGSVITTTGIKNQDIVKSVNNQKIDSYQKALQVFSKVKNQSQVEVSLLRDGQPLNLFYRIAN